MNKTLSLLWLSVSIVLFSVNADAKHYYFNHYTTHEGLPSNTVYNIVQDKFGYIWVSTRGGICRFDGKVFTEVNLSEQESVISGESMAMYVDERGMVWFSSHSGVNRYDPSSGVIDSISGLGNSRVSRILMDSKGKMWFISDKLFRYDENTGEVKPYVFERHFVPSAIVEDSFGSLWVLSISGKLYRYDSRKDSFEDLSISGIKRIEPTKSGEFIVYTSENEVRLLDPLSLSSEVIISDVEMAKWRKVLCMTERIPGEYWIGTENGILVYQEGKGIVDSIQESAEDKHAISASYVMSMFADDDGNIWAGTYYTGLNLWQDKKDSYEMFYDDKSAGSLKGNIVRPIKTDSNGFIWIGTEDGELNRYDPRTGSIDTFKGKEEFYNIQDFLPVNDEIWIASYGNGLIRYNPRTQRIVRRYSPGSEYVIRIFQTKEGIILAGTMSGLCRYDSQKDAFEKIQSVSSHFIHAIYQSHDGNIWLGTLGSGIRVIDSGLNAVAKINASEDNGLKSNRITSIYEDSKNRIWVTTEGHGVFYTSPEVDIDRIKFNNISESDGLSSDIACSVVEDRDGMIWISDTHGLSKFNPETSSLIPSFFGNSQITGSQFTFGSSCLAPNGIIYMGTTDGMVSFSPSILKGIMPEKELFITDITAKNYEDSHSLSAPGHSALTSDKVSVKSKDISTLEISFSIPDYSDIISNEYEYSLSRKRKETDSESVRTAQGKAVYTSLRHGQYVFNVKAVGYQGENNSKRLEIKVIPPIYLSTVAIIVYILIALALALYVISFLKKERENDKKQSIAQLENEKQKEIYDAKIKYFTNITHEIRTPLSLIKMPVDKIISTEGYKPEAHEDMLTIKANTDRLLDLTNQLLDLRKLEQKELKLILTEEDISMLVQKTSDYFMSTAKERHICLNVCTPDSPVYIKCSAESIKKILSNLISNAIKYGKDKIDIILSEDNEANTVSVRVNSNGNKIEAEDRNRIFEPFFQIRMSDDQMQGSNGTGLGLPFAKSLAELHNGRLYLDTDVMDTNSFVLEIPKEQAESVSIKEDEGVHGIKNSAFDNSRHTVIIVEDSTEMRYYIGKELSGEYNTLLASNGEEALNIIKDQKVDLIISDIMMPVMDGCELCNTIKTELDFCHIPVILLTAAIGVETRIQTLKVGADGYIEKPFSMDLLKATIANLFKNKEISYRQFTESPLSHYNGVVVNSIDDDFMERLHAEVMKHLSEQDLNIEALTTILGTSKSTLYRKIKANTGLNINEYIRLCRLKEAAEMLSSQKYRINEVAYLVGFSSPSYFTTSFQKQFNISPSAFVKHIKHED